MVVTYIDVPKPGEVYRHYKGDLYRVLHVATASNGCHEGDAMVVYEGINDDPPGSNVRVRSLTGHDGWDEGVGPAQLVDGRLARERRFVLVED